MYLAIVVLFMAVLPIGSTAISVGREGIPFTAAVALKWFVFWSVGVRLLVAGLRQIVQPRFTADVILGLKNKDSYFLVRELGFSNVGIGLLGVLSLTRPAWIAPGALVGGIFYLLAGISHLSHRERTRNGTVAMTSDLFVASVLLICLSLT